MIVYNNICIAFSLCSKGKLLECLLDYPLPCRWSCLVDYPLPCRWSCFARKTSNLTMLSCFMCGRCGSAMEATSPHKLHPSLEPKKLSNDVKANQLLMSLTKSHLHVSSDADLNPSALTKDKNPTSLRDATSRDLRPRLNESERTFLPCEASDCHTIQKEVVISTIVVKGAHPEECSSCTTQEVKLDENSTEVDAELLCSNDKSCSEARNKDSMSSIQDVFGKDETVNAGISCRSRMLKDNAKPHHSPIVTDNLPCRNTLANADGEITIDAIEEEATSSTIKANAEKPPDKTETNGIVTKLKDMGHHADKGVKSYRRKQRTHLFSYGISHQQRDFLFLCAGLIIQAVAFQLKSIVDVLTTLILLGYRVYFFAFRLITSPSHLKARLTEAYIKLLSYVVTQDHRQSLALRMEKLTTIKPLLATGAKKMGRGCVRAAYVLALLIALLLISFVFSYFAVKGSSRQEPVHIKKELFFDYTKFHPVASLDLLSVDAYHKSNASRGGKVTLMASVRYRCIVTFTLPESEYNRKLGVFQVSAELLSETGDILSKTSKPCMLLFKSNALHYVKSVCLAIPIIAGLTSETQTLSLQLLEWKQEAMSLTSASMLRILLVPRAGRAVSTGLPELYKAEIQVDSYWMSSSASASSIRTLVMWIGLSFFLFGCLSSFCMYKIHQNRNSS